MGQECKHQEVVGPYPASLAVRRITKKKRERKRRATNLTRIGIGRIGIHISARNRLIFFIRGWRNWRWARRNHMRRLLRRRSLDGWEHLHVAFTLIRPNSI